MNTSRRKFLNFLLSLTGLGAIGAIFYPVISYLIPPQVTQEKVNSIKAGKASAFPVNSYKIEKFGRKPVILVRDDKGEFHALSAVCTHLQCIVQYRKDTHLIWCACHNGLYNLHGGNISGPPPRPLLEYIVKIVNDNIIITQPS